MSGLKGSTVSGDYVSLLADVDLLSPQGDPEAITFCHENQVRRIHSPFLNTQTRLD
jgi:hypothetical protein